MAKDYSLNSENEEDLLAMTEVKMIIMPLPLGPGALSDDACLTSVSCAHRA